MDPYSEDCCVTCQEPDCQCWYCPRCGEEQPGWQETCECEDICLHCREYSLGGELHVDCEIDLRAEALAETDLEVMSW